jgi:hypothetical protein
MAKKHWIYIKRGLSEDPKHRANMGECIWLYMHIIDRADWETGIAYEWKDTQEAADMAMPIDTLRRQRQKLDEMGYISCEQKQHGQNITIHEWRNPREYGSESKNPRNEGMVGQPPSNDGLEIEGLNQGSNQGLNQGSNQVMGQVRTLPLSSKSKNSKSKSLEENSKKPHIPEGFPEPSGDGLGDWLEASRRVEEKNKPMVAVIEALADGFKYNFPHFGENKGLDRVSRLIAADGRDVSVFVTWAKENKRDPHWYHVKPDTLWGDWPQAFAPQTNSFLEQLKRA